MSKEKELLKYSTPSIVFTKIKKLFPYDTNLKFNISTRANKKYMIKGNFSNDKWIHFGQFGMEDFTAHNDEHRRKLFLKRNAKWNNDNPNSASFLSYWLLWN